MTPAVLILNIFACGLVIATRLLFLQIRVKAPSHFSY